MLDGVLRLAEGIGVLTRHIVRIRCGPLRAALWTAWYPVALIDFLMVAALNGALLRRCTWTRAVAVYLVGIDGIRD